MDELINLAKHTSLIRLLFKSKILRCFRPFCDKLSVHFGVV